MQVSLYNTVLSAQADRSNNRCAYTQNSATVLECKRMCEETATCRAFNRNAVTGRCTFLAVEPYSNLAATSKAGLA